MPRIRPAAVELISLRNRFENILRALQTNCPDELYSQSIGYWALPEDRGLPVTLLNKTVSELMQLGFDRLAGLPGIGPGKLLGLLTLLDRASKSRAEEAAIGGKTWQTPEPCCPHGGSLVTESKWSLWRESAVRHGLGRHSLGLLVPSLRQLPARLWPAPLESFLNCNLAELPAAGLSPSSTAVVIDVFATIHSAVAGMKSGGHLTAGLRPARMAGVEQWIETALDRPQLITVEELDRRLTLPLLSQLEIDLGVECRRAVESAVGGQKTCWFDGLIEPRPAMVVRWPDGGFYAARLIRLLTAGHEQLNEAAGAAILRLLGLLFDLSGAIPHSQSIAGRCLFEPPVFLGSHAAERPTRQPLSSQLPAFKRSITWPPARP